MQVNWHLYTLCISPEYTECPIKMSTFWTKSWKGACLLTLSHFTSGKLSWMDNNAFYQRGGGRVVQHFAVYNLKHWTQSTFKVFKVIPMSNTRRFVPDLKPIFFQLYSKLTIWPRPEIWNLKYHHQLPKTTWSLEYKL